MSRNGYVIVEALLVTITLGYIVQLCRYNLVLFNMRNELGILTKGAMAFVSQEQLVLRIFAGGLYSCNVTFVF